MRPPHRLKPRDRAGRPAPLELAIERIGTDGSGLARHEGRLIAVAGALPGEIVLAEPGEGRRPGRVLDRLVSSPDRVAAACRHFGRCGGCQLQHVGAAAYAAWKTERIAAALARAGVSAPPFEALATSPPGSRRRARLEARRSTAAIELGFHEPLSRRLVDLAECPVLAPDLAALLPACRTLLLALLKPGEAAQLHLTRAETGIDLGVLLPAPPDLDARDRLARFADATDLARLWWRAGPGAPQPLSTRRAPIVTPGGVPVVLPEGSFLQATRAGEAALVAQVITWTAAATPVADLFAGIGTFALPLAAGGRTVLATDGDAGAIGALAAAARSAGLARLTASVRDLDARPLIAAELDRFAAVILDPPRAGARAQAAELARSAVPTIVAISCDPATFARDAAVLTASAYALAALKPVDQFLWSTHVELAALFQRRPRV